MEDVSLYTKKTGFLITGLAAIALISLMRFLGLLQSSELKVFDVFLRLRPSEEGDERITIVEVTDDDIIEVGAYPIPDNIIVEALAQIQQYEPRAIGLDIFRDIPVPELSQSLDEVDNTGYVKLVELTQNNENIFVIDKILPSIVSPPLDVPIEQVGFADAVLDDDGFVRRSLLGNPDINEQYRFSLTVLLAQRYLEDEGYILENGKHDEIAMRFGDIELSSAHSSSRSYVTERIGPNPVVLINFRSGSTPFRKVSLSELLAEDVSAEWFKDRIVLVGVTASSVKDFVNSAAVSTANPGLLPGVEAQAHAVSQILSAVLDDRPILKTWSVHWEYLWIIGWGLMGIGLSRLIRNPLLHLIAVSVLSIGIFLSGYFILFLGWWIPVLPAALLCFFNGAVLYSFYWYERSLKVRIEERYRIIRQNYSAIHNGPAQTLAQVLKMLGEGKYSFEEITSELQSLNLELRNVYEFMMERGPSALESQLYMTGNFVIDLSEPLHELLYQVYSRTLSRPMSYFANIKVRITQFEPMAEDGLSLEHKHEVARFLEEALCNVGRYAEAATRLEVTCMQVGDRNVVRVIDNGKGLMTKSAAEPTAGGRGTRQASEIADKLRGVFQRKPNSPHGTLCELRWPTKPSNLFQFWH